MTSQPDLITTLFFLDEIGDYETDKNTTHSYIELYDQLFAPYCMEKITLLEIGNHQGGSLKLWNDYFLDVEIYGLEIRSNDNLTRLNEENENMHLTQGVDAYSHDAINQFFAADIFFDIIIDDGSHQPAHQSFVTNDWLPMLKPGGLLIIEDVFNSIMAGQIVMNTNSLCEDDRLVVFDRSNVKGREDDIVIAIKKGKA
jgi:hypothetical protein